MKIKSVSRLPRNGFNNGSTSGRNGCGAGSESDVGNGSSANNGVSDDPTYSGLDLDSADGALGGNGVGPPFRVLKKADVELKVGGKPKQYSVVIKVLPTDDPGEFKSCGQICTFSATFSHDSRNLP